jgi:hypothetical protein
MRPPATPHTGAEVGRSTAWLGLAADNGWWTLQGEPRHGCYVATEEDVRRVCLALPGVTERLSWGQPAWFARTLMARMWEHDVLTVKTDEREALVDTDPHTYYWTPHHDRSPRLVLVRLDRLADEILDELLTESYRLASGR